MVSPSRFSAGRRVLLACLLPVCWTLPLSAESGARSEQGLIFLRNGSVLQGQVIAHGDSFLVAMDGGTEIRVHRNQVLLKCETLEQVYHYQLRKLARDDAASHLRLARWCLRHQFLDGAKSRLEYVRKLDFSRAQLRILEQEIEWAENPREPPIKRFLSGPTGKDGKVEGLPLEKLPPYTIERFTSSVQPLLINACGNAACHGERSRSRFQLIRPPGRSAPRQFTLRNLHSTLLQVNREDPMSSSLLKYAPQSHGPLTRRVVTRQLSPQQYDVLRQWVFHAIGKGIEQPRVFQDRPLELAQRVLPEQTLENAPLPGRGSGGGKIKSGSQLRLGLNEAVGGSVGGRGTPEKPAQTGFSPRDPFDPEIFNRRFGRQGSK
ncbi:MAG: hypothetical protein CMJ81_15790 [Planctomycetaceae bacterium]|nr:hypothetical protein [Planctomycetaceae bacterium]MBP63226.1 hypothetical protein [Planctomycetaceae bacterium]